MVWIKCSEKLPTQEGAYLVYIEEFTSQGFSNFFYNIGICSFKKTISETTKTDTQIIHQLSNKLEWDIDDSMIDRKVTHWQSLPEEPKD